MAIWRAIPKPGTISNSFSLDWNSWLFAQLNCQIVIKHNIKWSNLFVYACWFIWKWRNKQIFDVNFNMPICADQIIWDYAIEWRKGQVMSKDSTCSNYLLLSWKKPPLNFFKLNIDGTKSVASGKIGAGGIIRDHNGNWVSGFQINLGVGEILDAEAWALYYGLKLADNLSIKNLEIESDSAILVQLMQMDNIDLHPLGSLLSGCKNLMSNMQNSRLCHVFRECNMTADSLAKNSISILLA